jgi:beta-galactosidase
VRSWTRRDVLKAGATAAGASLVPAGCAPAELTGVRAPGAATQAREQLLLDRGWRFQLGNASDLDRDFAYGRGEMFAKAGELFAPSAAEFDDKAWRTVDLPHDWAVELPFRDNVEELIEFGSKPLGRAYPETSIGWYRRVLNIPASDAGRRLFLQFDGVYRDAVVALNGHYLGRNLSGYAPFEYDISDVVDYGASNVLVVRVDATGREGWFYEGAGIYRHVWLVKTHALHVPRWGTFVTSALTPAGATLAIATSLDNHGEHATTGRVRHAVLDPAGATVAVSDTRDLALAGRARGELRHAVDVRAPQLWSIDTPALYRLVTTVEQDGAVVDQYETRFGIRTVHFDAAKGFFLNGAPLLIKGTCNHQDHAGVGSALPDRLQAYRIERLKAMGSNAYRTSHNPPTPELLDACDRLGMLVLDETRMFTPTEEGTGQLERLILRDRNHPSVFAWSIANEEHHDQDNPRGARIAGTLAALAHRLDPSRPVTAAMNGGWGGAGMSTVLDVQGCNYERPARPRWNLERFHQQFPDKPMLGTEVASTFCTRGVYAVDKARGHMTGYDVDKPGYGATAEEWWKYFAARPYLGGGFVWTGFDYRGEPSPYAWPCISSHFGIMDTCGFAKDNFYYYKSWWGSEPTLHVFPHWNWHGKEGSEIDVWVHSNLAAVELVLNGVSLGKQPMARLGHLAWKVPYAPGLLVARGYDAKGRLAMSSQQQTTGAAARIVLTADRPSIAADGEDVSVITVSVVDAQGRAVATADNLIAFEVSGHGALIGVGNGDPSSHEDDKGKTRRLFSGLVSAIMQAARSPGPLRIVATSPGLEPATLVVTCTAAAPRPSA